MVLEKEATKDLLFHSHIHRESQYSGLGYHINVSSPVKPPNQTITLQSIDPTLQRGSRLKFEKRVTILALAAGFPAVALCAFLLWYDGYSAQVQWTIDLLLVLLWLSISFNLKSHIVRPLQTLSNILAAIREGDYSIRGRRALSGDALGEVMLEVNDLGQTLREQRLGAMEATALLRTVMGEIDVAVFAFDGNHRLRLVNRAGEKLLAQPSARLLGRTSDDLGLSACLNRSDGAGPYTMQMVFPGGVGRWDIRRSTFREGGAQHKLLVLTDLSQTLREEERTAWQRLLRVLGHELNNSLAPIKSVAGSLADLMGKEPEPTDLRDDMQRGLAVISSRADSLARFVESYSKLARLPTPRLEPLKIGVLVSRVGRLDFRSRLSRVRNSSFEVMMYSSSSYSSTWCATQSMLQWRQRVESRLVGVRTMVRSRFGLVMKGLVWRIPQIFLYLSLRLRLEAPGSVWCYRARSPKRTAAHSRWITAKRCVVVKHV